MFPLGDTTKPDVRAEAAARGLRVADKPDSHDICFIPSGDTRGFLAAPARRAPGRGGRRRDRARCWAATTACTGSPSGSAAASGSAAPAADGRPRYVLGIEPVSGTVRVGPAEALDVHVDRRRATPVWSAGVAPGGPVECVGAGAGARRPGARDGRTRPAATCAVELGEPLRGVAPGQAVALYRPDPAGDVVLGSATITAAR